MPLTEISHMKASIRKDHNFFPSEFSGTLRHLRGVDKWTFGYTGLELRSLDPLERAVCYQSTGLMVGSILGT